MPNPKAFTLEQRQGLLQACFKEMIELERISADFEQAEGRREEELAEQTEALTERLSDRWKAYRDSLPSLVLSRCPFSGEPWEHSIDPFGLDGFWWNADKPMRPMREPLGGKYLCFTGAVKLGEPIEVAPFLCRPGPEVPFAVPRLLRHESVRAVISHLRIGPHDGYPIVYFADPVPPDVERTDDWGASFCRYPDENGIYRFDEAFDDEEDYDFDLKRWIKAGKILWIKPGDESLGLQSGLRGCPYVDLPGRRQILRIKNGEVWT